MSRSDAYDRLIDYLEHLIAEAPSVDQERYGIHEIDVDPGTPSTAARIVAQAMDWSGNWHDFDIPLPEGRR